MLYNSAGDVAQLQLPAEVLDMENCRRVAGKLRGSRFILILFTFLLQVVPWYSHSILPAPFF